MLESLKSYFRRRKVRSTVASLFDRHISKKVAEALARDEANPQPFVEHLIDFAYIAVFAPTVEIYSERLAILTELADQQQGLVHHLVPVAVIAFGAIPCGAEPPAGACARFIATLRTRLPDAVAIVHGSAKVSAGSFGTSHRLEWGFWWPGAPKALRLLGALGPGEIYEVLPDE